MASLRTLASGATASVPWTPDAAGLVNAKAALAAGGLMQIGPGLETLVLGSGWDNIVLALVTDDGVGGMSRFHMLDGADPTKRLLWDVSAITTGTVRTATAPNYSGLLLLPATLGNSGEFLRSGGAGVQPTWASVSASTLQHDELLHLKPEAITIGWVKNTATVTSSAAFGNVKVGDFIYLGANVTASTQGARVLSIQTTSSLTADVTKAIGDSDLVGATAIFQPGDHWNNTLAMDTTGDGVGLLLNGGRGTYSTGNTSGTFQELRGPIRWRGQGQSASTFLPSDFRVAASGSTGTKSGFCIDFATAGATGKAYFFSDNINTDVVFTLPDIDAAGNDTLVVTGLAQTLSSKVLSGSNTKIVSDGSTSHAVFQTAGGADFMSFSAVGTTLRNISVADYAGRMQVRAALSSFANGDTTPSVAGNIQFKTANGGATSITTFDDGYDGQEIFIRFADSNTTLVDGATLVLAGSSNFAANSTDTWTGVLDSGVWYEKCRSDNT